MKYTTAILGFAAMASAQEFTSIFNITATPDQVVTANASAPGQPGSSGQYNYAINSKTDTICWDITLYGVSGTPQSLAKTATHIHEGVKGKTGPPRLAFPDPTGDDKIRTSKGCMTGPFTTGLKGADNVTDTGAGFTLSKIEANPAGFFTDSHTNLYVPGVVRGQMDQSFKLLTPQPSGTGYTYYPTVKITTATLTATRVVIINKCPPTVVDCPYTTQPLTTYTADVYTTVCPESEVSTLPGYVTPAITYVKPAPTPTLVPFTGAASANKVTGSMLIIALIAALL